MIKAIFFGILTAGLLHPFALAAEVDRAKVTMLHTESGVAFGVLGQKAATPSPTLFTFGGDVATFGNLLGKRGWLIISMDIPCHGQDVHPGEIPNSLKCWRTRLESGTNFVAEFMANMSDVLNYLIQRGYTDADRVAASGGSRDGFIALNFAAVDSRVRCVTTFSPVTNLLALSEFAGVENDSPSVLRMVKSLALVNFAEKLAGRSIWVCIGNNDGRVGTDDAIAFTRRVVEVSVAEDKPPNVEIHVLPADGYQVRPHDNGHSYPYTSAHKEAAEWILARMNEVQ